jgi:hypothetical protein
MLGNKKTLAANHLGNKAHKKNTTLGTKVNMQLNAAAVEGRSLRREDRVETNNYNNQDVYNEPVGLRNGPSKNSSGSSLEKSRRK